MRRRERAANGRGPAAGASAPRARRAGLRRRGARRPRRPVDGARARRVARSSSSQIAGPLGAREAALVGLDVCARAGGGPRRRARCTATSRRRTSCARRRPHRPHGLRHRRGSRRHQPSGRARRSTSRPRSSRGQKASVQSDIYSVGVMLFYLVTGNFPVVGGDDGAVAAGARESQASTLRDLRPDVPEGFMRVVERALDSDPVAAISQRRRAGAGPARVAGSPAASRVQATAGRDTQAAPPSGVPFAAGGDRRSSCSSWRSSSGRGARRRHRARTSVTRVAVLPFRDISGDPTVPVPR